MNKLSNTEQFCIIMIIIMNIIRHIYSVLFMALRGHSLVQDISSLTGQTVSLYGYAGLSSVVVTAGRRKTWTESAGYTTHPQNGNADPQCRSLEKMTARMFKTCEFEYEI